MNENLDCSLPLSITFADGVYLATNAIPDAALIVDAPNCVLYKSERVHGNHDWLSTLSAPGRQRLFSSNLTLESLTMGSDGELPGLIEQVAGRPDISLILLSSTSMVTVTGKQYHHLMDVLEDRIGVPLLHVPSRDLYADWVEGYDIALNVLANGLELNVTDSPDPERVAVVGYLMDRAEGDHEANLMELRAMIREFGLDPLSIWLSGEPVARLADAGGCGTIISLPYGRRAARSLARRTGARVVEAPLPVGLDGTAAFLRALGQATGQSDLAEKLIRKGEQETLPRLHWPIAGPLGDLSYVCMADPHLLTGLVESLAIIGAKPKALFCSTRHGHQAQETLESILPPVVFEPTVERVRQTLASICESEKPDLAIGDSVFLSEVKPFDLPIMEFGYPSYFSHYLTLTPYFGYRGFLGIMERVANTLSREAFIRYDK